MALVRRKPRAWQISELRILAKTDLYSHHDWIIYEHHGEEKMLWRCNNPYCRWYDEYLEYEDVKRVARDPLGRFRPCPESAPPS